jgi:hypothetical protein
MRLYPVSRSPSTPAEAEVFRNGPKLTASGRRELGEPLE